MNFPFQVRFLQQQAKSILEEAALNNQLHHIACNFKKVPGKIYYVYKRDNGKHYMSMISPKVCSIIYVVSFWTMVCQKSHIVYLYG